MKVSPDIRRKNKRWKLQKIKWSSDPINFIRNSEIALIVSETHGNQGDKNYNSCGYEGGTLHTVATSTLTLGQNV